MLSANPREEASGLDPEAVHRYNESLDVELGEPVEHDLATILSSEFEVEHVLARNLPEEHLPPGLDGDFEDHVDRLGNLTLASRYWNNRYGNLPFEEKRAASDGRSVEYRSSTLRVQQVLADRETFDRAAIEQREDEIVEFALDEWHVGSPRGSDPGETLDRDVGDDEHAALVEVLRRAPTREWASELFGLLADLVETHGLGNDDPRLVTSLGRGDRVVVSVNNRYVVGGIFDDTPHYGLIFDGSDGDPRDRIDGVDGVSSFDPLSGEPAEETPYWLTFESGPDFDVTEPLREGWLDAVDRELDRASASPYRRHHRPAVYRATVDGEYRTRVLDDAFGPE